MSNTTTIAARITEAREAQGLNVAELAELAAVSTNTMQDWEDGTSRPRPNKLQMLAGVLSVPLLWFLDGNEQYDRSGTLTGRIEPLQVKMQRFSNLQHQMKQLGDEIVSEIAAIREAMPTYTNGPEY